MSPVVWGGSEELWSLSALNLARAGHRVGACVKCWPQPATRLLELDSAEVAVYQRKPVDNSLSHRLWRKTRGISSAQESAGRIAKWLRSLSPDMVCLSLANSQDGLDYVRLCRDLVIPYVLVVHGVYDSLWAEDALAEEMARLYCAARRCFFVSQSNRELCEDQIGTVLSNAEIVRNPFNVPYSATPTWPDPDPYWRLASVGRLEPHTKGQDILLRVLAADKWKQRKLKVAFYGGGEHFGGVVRKLAERQTHGRVEFHGHVADVEEIWRNNHGLVMPSRCEGMPLALVEAMLCSRMAIATDIAGHAEIVRHGVNGFLAAAPSVPLVDAALEEAWNKRQQWQAMGVKARTAVETLFPPDPAAVFANRLEVLSKTSK